MSEAPERMWRETITPDANYVAEYIRADIAAAEIERLREAMKQILNRAWDIGVSDTHYAELEAAYRAALAKKGE